jgi:hypothetical protein
VWPARLLFASATPNLVAHLGHPAFLVMLATTECLVNLDHLVQWDYQEQPHQLPWTPLAHAATVLLDLADPQVLVDLRGPLDLRECPDPLDQLETEAALDHPDLLDQVERLEPLDSLDQWERQATAEPVEERVLLDPLDQWDHLDRRDREDNQAELVNVDKMEMVDHLDLPAALDHLDQWDKWDRLDLPPCLETMPTTVRAHAAARLLIFNNSISLYPFVVVIWEIVIFVFNNAEKYI